MTLVNIDSTDIVDCKLKLILGLIWTLILHYAISMPMWEGPPLGGGDPVAQKTPKEKLRDWIQNKVPDLPVGNLTKDFQGPYSIEIPSSKHLGLAIVLGSNTCTVLGGP